ncbi:hypothetical protein S231_01930 [Candidatus Phytoplasma solani]|nr:hypothetical protein S231_01930 [Candidatus Phytoplasma solani]
MESNTKKMLIGIGTVVLLAVAGFAIWWFCFRKPDTKPVETPTPTNAVEQKKDKDDK